MLRMLTLNHLSVWNKLVKIVSDVNKASTINTKAKAKANAKAKVKAKAERIKLIMQT